MKILIIGLGSIAKKHIASILKLFPETIFYAFRSNINSINYNNVENIFDLNDTPVDIDFIIISNPTNLHASTIKKVIFFKKPIFIEKPIFDNIESNIETRNLINKSGIKMVIRISPIHLLTMLSSSKYLQMIVVLIGAHQKYLI